MSLMVQAKLKTGLIFGDTENHEYVYMPASELGIIDPICIYETAACREDISFAEAERLIRVRSLKPTKHPHLGTSTC